MFYVPLMAVIPAKAGIHVALMQRRRWIPAYAGMTAVRDNNFPPNRRNDG